MEAPQDLAELARQAADPSDPIQPREKARQLLSGLSAAQVRKLAIGELSNMIEKIRRAEDKRIEEAAQEAAEEAYMETYNKRKAEREKRDRERIEYYRREAERTRPEREAREAERKEAERLSNISMFETWKEDPSLIPVDKADFTAKYYQRRKWQPLVYEFKKWMGEDYISWYESFNTDGQDNSLISITWERVMYYGTSDQYIGRSFKRLVDHSVAEGARRGRLELTQELLATVMPLGDGGDRPTWGHATVAQHRQRLDMLKGQAAGTLETASRHVLAIQLITQYDVANLLEVKDQLEADNADD